ncbi:hypothetical protein FF011L_35710 [Roseimaritima multifibrata]|uniref:Uncharacterized protein n=1 Tax=Roseimaritima multifibrata TaxID=1930274 RepID=A0A517MIS3_9BACT|nr:hypothetical protein [Roseimaritima multifibrata]QDS94789.1 hypothetical protein FF011L_35710 [Roseimaritima multifibrata]
MRPDQWLVSGTAACLASLAFAAVFGLWNAPYRLRSVSAVKQKWGKNSARLFLLGLGILLLFLTVIVAVDWRPSFAR